MRHDILQSDNEIESLKKWINLTKEIDGDLCEIGVYKGGTARIIAENKKEEKKLFLIDTFEGLIDVDFEKDEVGKTNLQNGYFEFSDFESLKSSLLEFNCEIFKGRFPFEKPDYFHEKKFCFIHLDVDTFESTLNCLREIYDNLSYGGVILIHDYQNEYAPGVKKSVDIFLNEKGIEILEIIDTQCVIYKK
jgi:hypothetical protein